ncbi:MAG: hypothetical protein VB104_07835 [Candidatus Limiplasma sp.]|nr:hypothetical protein [Candidatus Limiplasma sp.]
MAEGKPWFEAEAAPENLPGACGNANLPMTAEDAQRVMGKMLAAMEQMGNMMAAMNESVQRLNRRMDRMERLTPGQAQELGRLIRQRVGVVMQSYGMLDVPTGDAQAAAKAAKRIDALIRRELRNSAGVEGRSLRDLPRCDYGLYVKRIALWDDYDAMTEVRKL